MNQGFAGRRFASAREQPDARRGVITGAAFCPHPPILVPEVASGAAGELDGVRSSCRTAIARIAPPRRRLVLLGVGAVSRIHRPHARGSLLPWGVALDVTLGGDGDGDDGGGTDELPISLTVGAWLVRDAVGPHSASVAVEIGPDFAGSAAEHELATLAQRADVAVLAMGDGSASRSTAAPGYLHEGAAAFDRRIADAMRSGVGSRLADTQIDPDEIAGELLCASVPVWHAVAGVSGSYTWAGDLLYDDAPYGVGYFVATWSRARSTP